MAVQFKLETIRTEIQAKRASLVLPEAICGAVLRTLDRAARTLVGLGVSANAITAGSIVLGAVAGGLLSFGQFGWAALVMTIASLGDALDGLVARRTGSASVAGALLDASGDRYQEFFFLGGLAVYLRESPLFLVITLLALTGSFMVSYGSAKAEALGVPVPPGVMRRAERAACLCLGAALCPVAGWAGRHFEGVSWFGPVPLLAAVMLIAVVANASAIRRLHSLARASSMMASGVRREPRPPADVVSLGGFRDERKSKKAPA